MKLRSIIMLCFVALTTNLMAQTPDIINYQAVVRDINNTVVTNQAVSVKFVITESLPTGTVIYEENQSPTTNSHGLINLKIGTGAFIVGNIASIDWGANSYYLTTSIDPTGGSNYSLSGVSELVSVPYALHAKTVDDKDDADADPTNEIELPTGGTTGQILETDGSGNYTWVNQSTVAQLTEAEVDAYVADNGYLTTEGDADPTNEIELPNGGINGQVLITDGAGNYSWVNKTVDTNTQLDEAQVDAFVADNGYITTEVDGSITNEIELPPGGTSGQVLRTNGSGVYTWVNQTADTDTDTQLTEAQVDAFVADNGYLTTEVDGSVTNEIQTLSISGSNLTISGTGGNTVALPSASAATFSIGQYHEGGIIVFIDSTGLHGLIAAEEDLNSGAFYAFHSDHTFGDLGIGTDYKDGAANTAAQAASGSENYAASDDCAALTIGGFSDWYIPSFTESIYIMNNLYVLDNINYITGIYWTSTETPGGNTCNQFTTTGVLNTSAAVSGSALVRPMRKF